MCPIRKFKRRLSQLVPSEFKYADYREYLRYEFRFRCAYCGTTEQQMGGHGLWTIDHWIPKSTNQGKRLRDQYDNLYYCCYFCNTYKGTLDPDLIVDPCKDRLVGENAKIQYDTGFLVGLTPIGKQTIALLRLNSARLVAARRKRYRSLVETIKKSAEILKVVEKMGGWAKIANEDLGPTTVESFERLLGGLRLVQVPPDQEDDSQSLKSFYSENQTR